MSEPEVTTDSLLWSLGPWSFVAALGLWRTQIIFWKSWAPGSLDSIIRSQSAPSNSFPLGWQNHYRGFLLFSAALCTAHLPQFSWIFSTQCHSGQGICIYLVQSCRSFVIDWPPSVFDKCQHRRRWSPESSLPKAQHPKCLPWSQRTPWATWRYLTTITRSEAAAISLVRHQAEKQETVPHMNQKLWGTPFKHIYSHNPDRKEKWTWLSGSSGMLPRSGWFFLQVSLVDLESRGLWDSP